GLADSYALLISSRAVQAVGGAMIMACIWPYTLKYYMDTQVPPTGYERLGMTMQAMVSMLCPIFTAIFAATLVAGETSHRTIHYVLIRPITRIAFLASKFMIAFAYATVLLLTGAVITSIVIAIQPGYYSMLDRALNIHILASQYWPQFILTFLMTLPALFATAAYGIFLSVLFRNTGAAVGTAAGLLVALEPLKVMIRWGDHSIAPVVWTNWFGQPMQLVVKLAANTPDLWNTEAVWMSQIVPAIWIVIFAAGSVVIMKRRDW
ncbi:MAG: ABC transporter permease, partial [Candidatus Sumerlaeota bacterium]|nr:ABC transporter permease [Candidatus Sumerlaeota bacterium]